MDEYVFIKTQIYSLTITTEVEQTQTVFGLGH